uniref:Uncharacterized protein n=1 Tax=Rhizophora mucronata TaxID=61149 RepID=A0A2P2P8X3_RHIMU
MSIHCRQKTYQLMVGTNKVPTFFSLIILQTHAIGSKCNKFPMKCFLPT